MWFGGFPGGASGKEHAYQCVLGSIPGSGRSPEEVNGNPVQYAGLENPMDKGAWQESMGSQKSDTTKRLSTTQPSTWFGSNCGVGSPHTAPSPSFSISLL